MEGTLVDSIKTKEKKTRRRLRLSCVECTKRRQKCDRKYPCSLCVTRGVEHLCRWESVPVARPTPARPPANALRDASTNEQTELIAELRRRILSLESELEKAREHPSSPALTSSSGSRTLVTSPSSKSTDISVPSPPLSDNNNGFTPSRDQSVELFLSPDSLSPEASSPIIDDGTYEITSTVAQLSLAHHGEFIGRGSLLCALHSMTSKTTPRFLYSKSTDPISEFPEPSAKFSKVSYNVSLDELMSHLPPAVVIEKLYTAFFEQVNWRYAIPEDWFRVTQNRMWTILQHRHVNATQINTNWLILLFSVIASAPRSAYDEVRPYLQAYDSDDFFMCAMLARRLVDDQYLNDPNASLMVSAADGTVLGCLATPLLCDYLAARGRVSEAWKLVGQGIRNAEAVGMHRDPEWKLWQMMSAEEKTLRRRAWWSLFISDKTYSYILGRPQMLRPEEFDVHLPSVRNLDGSKNLYYVGINLVIDLMTLLGVGIDACFNAEFPGCSAFLEMDRKLQDWESRLPREYSIHSDPQLFQQECTPSDLKLIANQRYLIHTWVLIARLKFHVASTTGIGTSLHSPQDPADIRHSMEQCVIVSLEIIRYQCAIFEALTQNPNGDASPYVYPGSSWLFEGCYSLFEASVSLITTLAQLRWQEKSAEATVALDMAKGIFKQILQREQGKTRDTAARALEVLITIQSQVLLAGDDLAKVKVEPELLDPSMVVNINKTGGNMGSVFASTPHFLPENILMEGVEIPQLPRFSRLFDLTELYTGRETARMGGHMNAPLSMGIERGAIRL